LNLHNTKRVLYKLLKLFSKVFSFKILVLAYTKKVPINGKFETWAKIF
jgi:hypothetical protein